MTTRTLDDIEKLIASAPLWSKFDTEKGNMLYVRQEEADFFNAARELMPKLLKVVRAVQDIEFVVQRYHAEGGNDSFKASASVSIAKMNTILTAIAELMTPEQLIAVSDKLCFMEMEQP